MSDFVEGVDASKWQGVINWTAVHAQLADATHPIEFAIVKATEGALAPGTPDATAVKLYGLDSCFRANWAGIKSAGMIRGAYHFLRCDAGNSPEAEADWFLSVVAGALQPGDLVALDAEAKASVDQIGRWLRRVKAKIGFNSLFYSYRDYFQVYGITYAKLKTYGVDPGLWLSVPDTSAPPPPVGGFPFVAIWQGAATPLAGVAGRIDRDRFAGSRDQLLRYGKPAPVPPPVSTPTRPPVAPESNVPPPPARGVEPTAQPVTPQPRSSIQDWLIAAFKLLKTWLSA